MGDRIVWDEPCKCGGTIEYYDAPSSLLFTGHCDKCDFRDPRNYYEIDENTIILCTLEEARKEGGLITCPKCKREVMGSYRYKDGCIECTPYERKEDGIL